MNKEQSCKYIYDFYFDELAWCGCGAANEAMDLMRDVLRAISNLLKGRDDEQQARWQAYKARMAELLGPSEAVFYSYLYVLDAADLIDHGTNIRTSWLTEKGETLLSHLENIGSQDWSERGAHVTA